MDKQYVALMRFNYGGKTLEVGDPFTPAGDHADRDADLYLKLGRVRKAEAKDTKEAKDAEPAKGYQRRDMKAAK